ncbi:MAG TPA: hypothetical protein VJH06_01100 [Candidatus Paceibacterota bacterium]
MKTKIFSLTLCLVIFATAGLGMGIPAQAATFPDGCASGIGYSATTGSPCNGTSNAAVGNLPGCTTPLGYSSTSGVPCSGTSTALAFLAGCTSLIGYSSITGEACNGTGIATLPLGGIPNVPGLPTTGDGGKVLDNAMILVVSGLLAVLGTMLFAKEKSNLS